MFRIQGSDSVPGHWGGGQKNLSFFTSTLNEDLEQYLCIYLDWNTPQSLSESFAAITVLKDKEPGSFIVRDSHSFRGAYGLAMKVSTPPPSVLQLNKKGIGWVPSLI